MPRTNPSAANLLWSLELKTILNAQSTRVIEKELRSVVERRAVASMSAEAKDASGLLQHSSALSRLAWPGSRWNPSGLLTQLREPISEPKIKILVLAVSAIPCLPLSRAGCQSRVRTKALPAPTGRSSCRRGRPAAPRARRKWASRTASNGIRAASKRKMKNQRASPGRSWEEYFLA